MSTKDSVERKVRDSARAVPGKVVAGILNDPGATKELNRWMIGTHISWGITLAVTFIGLNYTLIWLSPPPWVVSVVFTPLGIGYLAWQWRKFRPMPSSMIKTDAEESSTQS